MDPRSSITVVRLRERQFLIPTEVLRRCCPALRRRLPGGDATITQLELSGIPEATFENLVYYFRTGRSPDLNIQNVIDVYSTASDLGIRPLEKKCWKYVFEMMSKHEQSLLLLVESEKGVYMSKEDTQRLMDVLVKSFRKTVNSAAFLQLTEKQVRHLLSYPPVRTEHGINATYKAAMRWLHADCRARHGFVEKLTSALGETPDATLAQTLSICPTIAREVSKLSQDSPSPKAAAKSPVTTETKKQQPQPVAPEPPIEAAKEVEGKQNVPKRGKEKLLKELPVERQQGQRVALVGGRAAPTSDEVQYLNMDYSSKNMRYGTTAHKLKHRKKEFRRISECESSMTNAEREPSKWKHEILVESQRNKRSSQRKLHSRASTNRFDRYGIESDAIMDANTYRAFGFNSPVSGADSEELLKLDRGRKTTSKSIAKPQRFFTITSKKGRSSFDVPNHQKEQQHTNTRCNFNDDLNVKGRVKGRDSHYSRRSRRPVIEQKRKPQAYKPSAKVYQWNDDHNADVCPMTNRQRVSRLWKMPKYFVTEVVRKKDNHRQGVGPKIKQKNAPSENIKAKPGRKSSPPLKGRKKKDQCAIS